MNGPLHTTSSLLAISALLIGTSVPTAIDLTSCGKTVPRGQVGEMRSDLDCSRGARASDVAPRDRATLTGHGHRINAPATRGPISRPTA